MKAFYITTILFIAFQVYGQDLSEREKGSWYVTNYIGFAVLESEDSFKTNANVYGGIIGKEFLLNKSFDLLTGVEFQRIRSDVPNSNYHFQSLTVKIPVSLAYNAIIGDKTILQVQAGVYSGYLLKTTIEDLAIDVKDSESGLGLSFGLGTFIGFSHFVTQNVGFRLGIISQGDLFHSFKKEYNTLKVSDLHALQFGLLIGL